MTYKYTLVPVTASGMDFNGSVALDDSFMKPLYEWAHFRAMSKGLVPCSSSPPGSSSVPRWSATLGTPYVDGFFVTIFGVDGGEAYSEYFPISVLDQYVRAFIRAAADQPSQGTVAFRVCAVQKHGEEVCPSAGLSFTIDEIARPLDICNASFLSLMEHSACPLNLRQRRVEESDPPVFITRRVMSEISDIYGRTGDTEAGGIMAGHLCRGNEDDFPGLFVVITSQIQAPAGEDDRGPTRIRFTSETWSYLRETLRKRDRGEQMLGWWHTHPFARMTNSKGHGCVGKEKCIHSVFFSASDVRFHHVAFSPAYTSALVVGSTPCSEMESGLFGWRRGRIEKREFYIVTRSEPEIPVSVV